MYNSFVVKQDVLEDDSNNIDCCNNEQIYTLVFNQSGWCEELGKSYFIGTQDKIPIAKCANPECGRAILYSKNPREKMNVTVRIAEPGYTGPTYRCAHCNTMLVVIEKPKVAAGYVALPIIAANA